MMAIFNQTHLRDVGDGDAFPHARSMSIFLNYLGDYCVYFHLYDGPHTLSIPMDIFSDGEDKVRNRLRCDVQEHY